MKNPDQLLVLQRQLTVFVLIMLALFMVFQIGAYFGDLLRILAISMLLSYLVINMVDFLDRFMRNRAVSVAVVYVCLLAVIIVAVVLVVPAMVYQVSQLITSTFDHIPEWLHQLEESLAPLQARFEASRVDIKIIDVVNNLVTSLPKPDPGAVVTRITDIATSTMTWAVYSVSISVVSFYFLLDGHRMKDAIISLFPSRSHAALDAMAHDMDRSLQAFFKGQLVLGLMFGLFMLGIYVVLNVQYALLLSVFLGFCEILPVIGPPIGFAPAAIAVAIHGSILPGDRFMQILILTAIFAIFQQVKDNVVAPRYIGNVIGLHPVLIFVAIMVGARIDGMLGIIISLPAACVVNVLINHLPLRDEVPGGVATDIGVPVIAEAGATTDSDTAADLHSANADKPATENMPLTDAT
jgi:predicted PurR-regulated permease PerM